MAFLSIFAAFAARALLVLLFLPFSALDKILNFKSAVSQAAEAIPNRSLAAIMIFAGLGIEIFMSLAILTGIWKAADFRLRGASHGWDTFWDFLKNLALAGGFLVLAFGANATGFKAFLVHPLASSHPYAQIDRTGRS